MRFMAQIFISYKRANYNQVVKIVKYIESELSEKCWMDIEGIEYRTQFASTICKAIDESKIVLFMYSSMHLNIDYENDWTVKELSYAHAKNKIVVLVKLDDSRLENIFLLNYGSKNNVDSKNSVQLEKLVNDIGKWLGKTPKHPTEPSAQNDLGKNYYYGRNGLELDYTEAVHWFQKSAEQGFANAQYNLGVCYRRGRGVIRDEDEAIKWYLKAAEQGHVDSQYLMGECFERAASYSGDYSEAVKWHKRAASQGHPKSQCAMGYFYKNGLGVKKSKNEAIKWYKLSAEQGNKMAKEELEKFDCVK